MGKPATAEPEHPNLDQPAEAQMGAQPSTLEKDTPRSKRRKLQHCETEGEAAEAVEETGARNEKKDKPEKMEKQEKKEKKDKREKKGKKDKTEKHKRKEGLSSEGH